MEAAQYDPVDESDDGAPPRRTTDRVKAVDRNHSSAASAEGPQEHCSRSANAVSVHDEMCIRSDRVSYRDARRHPPRDGPAQPLRVETQLRELGGRSLSQHPEMGGAAAALVDPHMQRGAG